MTIYFDSSALVKSFLDETGSELVIGEIAAAPALTASRLTLVETARVIGRVARDLIPALRERWSAFDVVEISPLVCERAIEMSGVHDLRTLDLIHLSTALVVPRDGMVFATWDRRLHAAARAEGFETLPGTLG